MSLTSSDISRIANLARLELQPAREGLAEIDAPVLKQLDLVASGRFDDYSTGQSNFSPKLGFKWTPIEMLAFRGTWSQGFRIPSFRTSCWLMPS